VAVLDSRRWPRPHWLRPGLHPAHPSDLLVAELATRFTEGLRRQRTDLEAGAERLSQPKHPERGSASLALACPPSRRGLSDDERWEVLTARHVQLGRETAALTVLPFVVGARSGAYAFAGELAAATSLLEEVDMVAERPACRAPVLGEQEGRRRGGARELPACGCRRGEAVRADSRGQLRAAVTSVEELRVVVEQAGFELVAICPVASAIRCTSPGDPRAPTGPGRSFGSGIIK
jgi:hypothetical protein